MTTRSMARVIGLPNMASLCPLVAVAALLLMAPLGRAYAVQASPPTVTCTGQCETCIEMEGGPGGDRCVKCGIAPNCLGNPADAGLSSDFTTLVNAHNAYRGQQCAPALTWSAQLAAGAQAWANACTKQHSNDAWKGENGFGENLYWGSANLGDADDAVKWWYDEIKDYSFTTPVWSNAVGHFTQVVWKGSKQIGCGVARCGDENYWVCRYSPTGNWNVNNPGVLAANVGCAQPAASPAAGNAPAPGNEQTQPNAQNTAKVVADVDVYDSPGGNGKLLGVLAAGKSVSLSGACSENWCNVEGNDVPSGKGWVYDGPDYDSLKY